MRSRRGSMFHAVGLCLLGLATLAGFGAISMRPARRPATPAPAEASPPSAPPTLAGGTLLDEVGHIAGTPSAEQVQSWKQTLHAGGAGRARDAWLNLWLGEVALGQDLEPSQALRHLRTAERLAGTAAQSVVSGRRPPGPRPLGEIRRSGNRGGMELWREAPARRSGAERPGTVDGPRLRRCRGLAEYDTALALFYAGAYRESAAAFHALLAARPAAVGFERRRCALWYRHAAACAGYHAEREKLGIPEPSKLDPECGAAGLAVCLRGLHMPCDRRRVLAACRVGGEGSSLRDLVDGCPKLGLRGRAVTADEAGLKALPKPLVAYVEHDHFIAVVRADAKGVSYVCSDCGCWPGGRVDLTWRQWRALEPGAYLAVAKLGGPADRALSQLPLEPAPRRPDSPRPLRLASASLSHLHLWGIQSGTTLLSLLRGHVFAFLPTGSFVCGGKPTALACPPTVSCPMDGGGCGGSGPSSGDPVNLATGEEEYSPGPDIAVYNPHGPAVVWSRSYRSLRSIDPSYQNDDFGMGWAHPYNVLVADDNYLVNPQVPAGATAATLVAQTGQDSPAAGSGWDIVLNGTVIASTASPAGWTVSYAAPNFSVAAPAGATSTTNYEVRYAAGAGVYHSAYFDVAPANTYPQGYNPAVAQSGSDAPGAGLLWDVLLNGTTVASSAQPNGWSVAAGGPPNQVQVQIPFSATVSSGYEARLGSPALSGTFTVIASRSQIQAGTKYVQFANGSRIRFTAPSVPTAGQPAVKCAADPGAPFFVTWNYDSTDPYGHYSVTFTDGSQWVTTTAAKLNNPGTGLSSSVYYALSQMADRVGNAINLNYGAAGPSGFPLLASITDASTGAALLTLTRATDGTGNVVSVSDAYGRSVYYHASNYPSQGVHQPFVQSYQEVDMVSQIVPTGTVNPANRYTYGYQNIATGDDSETVAFLHTITVPSPTGTGTSTATINYTGPPDYVSSLVDADGNSRNYTQVDGTHTQVTLKDSLGNTVFAWTVGFDSNMHPTSVTDGAGNTVGSAAYSDPNDPHRPSSITEGNGKTTSFTWDQYGHLVTATSPRTTTVTNTWSYSTFSLGRLTSVQEGSKTSTTFSYFEPSGLIQWIKTPTPGTAGTGSTVQTSFTYSPLGNVLTVTGPGNNAASTTTTTFNYTNDPGDSAHGIAAYSQAEALGQPLTVTDNLGKVSHFRYNPRGVMIAAIDALGSQRTVSINLADQPVATTDPPTGQTGLGCGTTIYRYLYPGGPASKVQQFDESGTMVREIDATFGPEGEALSRTGSGETLTESFDAAHRLVSLTDGDNHQTTFSYNPAGYLSAIHYPGGDSLQFTSYDGSGRPLTRVDGNAVTTNYQYSDAAGRLSDILYPATPVFNVHLGYDGYGRLSSISNGTGNHGYSFDDLNNTTEVTTSYASGPAGNVYYAFYPDGSRQSMMSPAGSVSYGDDADGRLASLTNTLNETSSWTYLDNGWLATQQLTTPGSPPPVVATTTYTHNAIGFITDATTRNGSNAILSEFGSMTADADGNRKAITASLPGTSGFGGLTSYGYDGKLQLTQESSARNGGYTNNFVYDSAGNPTTLRGATQGYNADNQNTGVAYDNNGNPTTNQGQSLTYKPENRLASWGSAMSAGYLPDGLRGWKQNSSGYTYFIYDGALPVAETDSTGSVIAVNTFGANGLLSRHASRLTTFYTFDPQGNVAQRLNSSGSVLSSHMFDAYGLELSSPATSEPWGFGAQWGDFTDRESGLVLMAHRYYDPHLARFLTRDPSGYAAGLNLYGYAGNNPASYCDPDGHFVLLVTGAIGAGVGAVIGGGIAWWNGDNIWVGAGKGFVLGGIAGLTGGLAGEAVAGWVGGTAIANGVIGGFAGGVVGDAAQQGAAMLFGWRNCFSWSEVLASGALGGVLGGVGGWWAESRGATVTPESSGPRYGPIRFNPRNLQHEYHGHGADFGVTGNWSRATGERFAAAIQQHWSEAPQVIVGTFRDYQPAIHYFDPATGLWAGFSLDEPASFLGGWKLYPSQVTDLLTNGNVR